MCSYLSALASHKFVGVVYILHYRPIQHGITKVCPVALQSTAGCICIKNTHICNKILWWAHKFAMVHRFRSLCKGVARGVRGVRTNPPFCQ